MSKKSIIYFKEAKVMVDPDQIEIVEFDNPTTGWATITMRSGHQVTIKDVDTKNFKANVEGIE